MDKMSGTKEKIFKTSLRLFALKGYEGTSIKDITDDVGISKASLYNHYNSKECILESIFDTFGSESEISNGIEIYLGGLIDSGDCKEVLKITSSGFLENSQVEEIAYFWQIVEQEQFRSLRASEQLLSELNQMRDIHKIIFELMKVKNKISSRANIDLITIEYSYSVFTFFREYNLYKLHGKDTEIIIKKLNKFIDAFSEELERV